MRLNRIWGQASPVLLTLAVCVLIAVACGTTDVPTPGPQSGSSASTSIQALSVPTPTVPIFHSLQNPLSLVSPSIEEQILTSAVIVRASLLSATAGTETVAGSAGVAPTYRAVQELRFSAREYLKGTGPEEAVVVVRSDHTYLTEAEALQAATALVSDRNTTWDDREGVLFLKRLRPGYTPAGASDDEESGSGVRAPGATPAPAFEFTLSNSGTQTEWDYTVDTLSRAWLPASDSGVASGNAARSSDPPAPVFITDGAQSPPPVITLVELRSKVTELEVTMKEGDGIAGYHDCIYGKILRERHRRVKPWTPFQSEAKIPSGSVVGTEVQRYSNDYNEPQYHRFWLSGPDTDYFRTVIVDDDSVSSNGYHHALSTTRALPSGQYRVFYNTQHYGKFPCNFKPDDAYDDVTVTVTAPTGTLQEAFFDPGAAGGAVGFSPAAGSMEPAEFTVGGIATAIGSLLWQDGSVVLTLAPYAALTGYRLDFIELDGSVGLSLTAADATADETAGTLTWPVAGQPWQDGDQLMLRIHEAETAVTPTPTPTLTPTPTPTPTPAPTLTPTPMPTLAPAPPAVAGAVWSATMTVGTGGGYLGYGEGYGDGALTPGSFTWRGTEYTVEAILHNPYSPNVSIDFTTALPDAAVDSLTLRLGDRQLSLADTTSGNRQFLWYPVRLDWTVGDTVFVYLTE